MKSVLIIGLGKLGFHLSRKLNEINVEVMGVDTNESSVNRALPYLANAKIGNATDEYFLKSLGINNYDVCFVTIGDNFQDSLETTFTLKDLGAKKVISAASSDRHAKFLLRNGADKVIYPERHVAEWAAIRYGTNHVLDYFQLDQNNAFLEIEIPKKWLGKTVGDLNVRKNFDISIIAMKKDGVLSFNISSDTKLTPEYTILVLGEEKKLAKYAL